MSVFLTWNDHEMLVLQNRFLGSSSIAQPDCGNFRSGAVAYIAVVVAGVIAVVFAEGCSIPARLHDDARKAEGWRLDAVAPINKVVHGLRRAPALVS